MLDSSIEATTVGVELNEFEKVIVYDVLPLFEFLPLSSLVILDPLEENCVVPRRLTFALKILFAPKYAPPAHCKAPVDELVDAVVLDKIIDPVEFIVKFLLIILFPPN